MRRNCCALVLWLLLAAICANAKDRWISIASDITAAPGTHPSVLILSNDVARINFRAYRIPDPIAFFRDLPDRHSIVFHRSGPDNPLVRRATNVLRPITTSAPIAAWQVAVDAKQYEEDDHQEVDVPVSAAGVYLIEASAGRTKVYTVVFVTDLVMVLQSTPSMRQIFLAKRSAGKPVPDCDVTLITDKLDKLRTGHDGLLTVLSLPKDREALLLAHRGDAHGSPSRGRLRYDEYACMWQLESPYPCSRSEERMDGPAENVLSTPTRSRQPTLRHNDDGISAEISSY